MVAAELAHRNIRTMDPLIQARQLRRGDDVQMASELAVQPHNEVRLSNLQE